MASPSQAPMSKPPGDHSELERLRIHVAELELELSLLKQQTVPKKEFTRRISVMQTLIDAVPVALAYYDKAERFVVVNRAYAERFGATPTQLIGKAVSTVVDASIYQRMTDHVQGVFAGQPLLFEAELAFERLGIRFVRYAFNPVWDETGAVQGLTAVVTDITAEKQVEGSLRELDEKLKLFIGTAPAAFAMFDSEMRYLAVSKRYLAEFGLGESSIVGLSHYDLLPYLPERWKELHTRCLAGESFCMEEDCFETPDGRTEWLKWEIQPWHTARGAIGGMVLACELVTKAKQARDVLEEHRQQLQLVTEGAQVGLAVLDQNHCYRFVNQAYARMLDLEPGDIVGRPMRDVLKPIYEQHILNRMNQAFSGATVSWEATLPPRKSDSVERKFSVVYEPSRATSGAPAVVAVVFEITERVRMQKALEQQLALVKAIAENASTALFFTDDLLRCVFLNPAAERLTGYSMAEAKGHPLHDIVHGTLSGDACCSPDACLLNQAFREKTQTRVEDTFFHRSAHCCPVCVTVSPIHEKENVTGIVVEVRDISEEKRAASELSETNERLRRANLDLEHFAYSASHDLQEPLRNISLYGQLLSKKHSSLFEGQAAGFLNGILEGSRRMADLMDGWLKYSRSISSMSDSVSAVDAEAALAKVEADLQPNISAAKATLTRDVLPHVRIRTTHLEQIFYNLIGNSLKYRDENRPPVIHLTSRREGKQWLFAMTDNGIGIDPQYHQSVFMLFQRLHGQERYNGTGIGLALCQKVVERYGGQIWVESQLGKGCTFYFTLPA